MSYALGMDLGQQMHRLSVELDPSLFARGLGDGLSNGKTLMTREEAQAVITALQEELQRKVAEQARAQASAKAAAAAPAEAADQAPAPKTE